jgi:hypothetical protein
MGGYIDIAPRHNNFRCGADLRIHGGLHKLFECAGVISPISCDHSSTHLVFRSVASGGHQPAYLITLSVR